MPDTFVDRGGTFTDIVTFFDDGSATVRKVPSDLAVVGELAVGALTFGTTVATNALLEHAGVPTLLLVTQGFADIVRIGTTARSDLFRPEVRRPDPMSATVVEVAGRLNKDGAQVTALHLPTLDLRGIASVAIVLMHSGADPRHELELAQWIRHKHPNVRISLGHACSPTPGYLARIQTTLVDACITPLLADSLLRDKIPPDALAIRSDGSLCPATELRAPQAVLSGPAGGVLAVQEVARIAGFSHAVGLDMGGTSTDVCRIDVGALPRREGDIEVAGVQLRQSMLEVHTIAAGGGSVLSTDGRTLRVGPQSAGAHPGPQCYGRGGPPTLTDAALAAGLMRKDSFDPPLNLSCVNLPDDAHAYLNIARQAMAEAVRTLATQRGVSLHDHALVAYGGAAGQHAAAVADRLGIGTVLVHPFAAVLSAWGQSLARPSETVIESVWRPLREAFPTLSERVTRLQERLPVWDETSVELALRYPGTDHSLRIRYADNLVEHKIIEAFEAEHQRRYGFVHSHHGLQLASIRVTATAAKRTPAVVPTDPWHMGEAVVSGPALISTPTTSVQVPEGWNARREHGLLVLRRTAAREVEHPYTRTPEGVALWSRRFMAVAEQAGAVLQRLARSVNIRERLDFSCAVFDERGHLVANAPHIPVHLGAMGETVRHLMATHNPLPDGQSWLCNDPSAGGSHLPDLTVITAVHHDERRFFVACRGHHVDVGGTTPGSMPPRSTRLADEGIVLRHVPLLRDGQMRDLGSLLAGTRVPGTVAADLAAQVASNHHAARALRRLGPADLLTTWMQHLQDVADESVKDALVALPSGAASDDLDGVPLRLRVACSATDLTLDWTGTGGPHPGNLNAPAAVVRAATLYSLRLLVDRDIPLNEGALRHVRTVLPDNSVLKPSADCAVAGGNVETSQRLVDLLLMATNRMAASAGSMSNLTLGGDGWAFYETVAGGAGASRSAPGASARQAHMTNTRATDPEVLERRCPLRVVMTAIRGGSGGDGVRHGGDGMVRELEVLEACTGSLLAAWRERGAPGLHGGGDGTPGYAELRMSGEWRPWTGDPTQLQAGDRIRVFTPGGGGWGQR